MKYDVPRPVSCQLLTRSLCPCVASNTAKPRSEFLSDLASVRASLRRVVSSPAYQDRMNAGMMITLMTRDQSLTIITRCAASDRAG